MTPLDIKTFLEIEQEHYRQMEVNRNKTDEERYNLILKSENKEYIDKESLIKYLKEKRNYHHNLLEVRQRNVIENILKELENER